MNTIKHKLNWLLAAAVIGSLSLGATVRAEGESNGASAHKSPEWLKSSVVYEIFTRNFSKQGDFNAITARLDELKDLGVDIVWLMPIHPVG